MKSLVQIFIMITLLVFYVMPSYADIAECSFGVSIGYTVNKLMASSNKTETIDCNEKPELSTTHHKDRNNTE